MAIKAEETGNEGRAARIIAVANQKGGVGKTTTAINLSSSLAEAGRAVLLVDLDPQANATSGLGMDENERVRCVGDVLAGRRKLMAAVEETGVAGLSLVPAANRLAGVERRLSWKPRRTRRLKKKLKAARARYDYVILDCPPSLGFLTINALVAADGVIVPVQCEYFALEGLSKVVDTVKRVRTCANPNLELAGVLMTMHEPRRKLSREVVSEVNSFFLDKAFKTVIPRSARLSEAPSFGQPINQFDGRSAGAKAYAELTREVMALE